MGLTLFLPILERSSSLLVSPSFLLSVCLWACVCVCAYASGVSVSMVSFRIGEADYTNAQGAFRQGKWKIMFNAWCSGYYAFGDAVSVAVCINAISNSVFHNDKTKDHISYMRELL